MPQVIICDLDSTICEIGHRLHHITGEKKDYDAFYAAIPKDSPRLEIIDLMTSFASKGYPIVFLSGRPEKTAEDTVAWFKKHVTFPHRGFIFRKDGDFRPAVEVKRELYKKLFKPDEVFMAIDDDKKILEMWREEGIPVVVDVSIRVKPVVQLSHEETAPKVRSTGA